jgi:hypothetical protein
MSEAIWIELIKVLPAFLWVGFGFIALAIARRIFTAQAPRMTKVETPWVTVELAQQAIEQASIRGPMQVPALEPDWSQLYPSLPAQQVRPGFGQPAAPGGGTGTVPPPILHQPVPFGDAPGSPVDAEDAESEDEFQTEQHTDAETKPPNTPPADEPADNTLSNGGKQSDDIPPSPVTEPNRQVPNVPPTYPVIVAPPGGYYAPPVPARPTSYAASAPLPPYGQPPAYPAAPAYGQPRAYQPAPAYGQPPAYQPAPADAQRGLRAATKLALSADRLQGGAILWVDDDHEWNEPLIRLFRTAGIIVDPVASTDEAMRAFKNRSYDLVITDMRREHEPDGGTAGIQFLDRMIAAGIPTPAVFFSDHSNAHTVGHPRAVLATNSPEKLVDTVVDIVSARHVERTRSGGPSWLERLRG